jgi:hypothetical protein
VDLLPPQPVSTPDDEFQAIMQQNKRKWISSQMIRYTFIFNRYQQYKDSNTGGNKSGATSRITKGRDII